MIAMHVDSRGDMMDGLPGEREAHYKNISYVVAMHIPTTRVIQ